MTPVERKAIRRAVANYMQSEGCGCCQNTETHRVHAKVLAKLLRVPMFQDRSGFNFGKFRSQEKPEPTKR